MGKGDDRAIPLSRDELLRVVELGAMKRIRIPPIKFEDIEVVSGPYLRSVLDPADGESNPYLIPAEKVLDVSLRLSLTAKELGGLLDIADASQVEEGVELAFWLLERSPVSEVAKLSEVRFNDRGEPFLGDEDEPAAWMDRGADEDEEDEEELELDLAAPDPVPDIPVVDYPPVSDEEIPF